jgi:hypothetical protein
MEMEMELDLVLNWIGFKFFVKMTRIKSFKIIQKTNLKIRTSQTKGSKKTKEFELGQKVPFEIKN